MKMTLNVGRNNQRALRRMDWRHALRLVHPTGLEQTIVQNVEGILSK